MRHSNNYRRAVVMAAGLCISWLLFGAPGGASAAPEVHYKDGLLTVRAHKEPLLPLLESVGKAAGINIFVSTSLKGTVISAQIINKNLEEGLKSLLRDFSYAVFYNKRGTSWQISALKIYPKGKQTGEVVSLVSGKGSRTSHGGTEETKAMLFHPGHGSVTYGGLGHGGLLVPSRTVVPHSNSKRQGRANEPLFKLQMRLERIEARKYQELMLLKRRVEAALDPDRKAALSMAYAEEARKFYAMKKSHLNKMEALKRIYQSREATP